MKTALWWVRRDLRLSDNQALAAALEQAEQVLPVFVLDPKLLNSSYVGEKRLAFLLEGLHVLKSSLLARGCDLIVRRGEPVQVLASLQREAGAEAIFAEADYSPYARRRDGQVAKELPLHLTAGLTVQLPEKLVKADGKPYTVFTPFSKAWQAQSSIGKVLPAPERISMPSGLRTEEIPASPAQQASSFPAGEAEAQRRLELFVETALTQYGSQRDRMDLEGTSGLSPYLRFGMLSPRQAVTAARTAISMTSDGEAIRSIETWLNELIWREFYMTVLYHFPFVRRTAFRHALREIPWVNDPQDFAAWAEGQTGYPVVDAAQRQLVQSGWMHNRARMISASFLTKDLLVDWRWGERIFMQHLIDGDPAANNGGWQWTAGTGTDAAPYFRIFNPVLQSMKFDPQGNYIRRYVPELANVPSEYIHSPWKMPLELQKKSGCLIGKHYPAPIVDHAQARERVKFVYKQ